MLRRILNPCLTCGDVLSGAVSVADMKATIVSYSVCRSSNPAEGTSKGTSRVRSRDCPTSCTARVLPLNISVSEKRLKPGSGDPSDCRKLWRLQAPASVGCDHFRASRE